MEMTIQTKRHEMNETEFTLHRAVKMSLSMDESIVSDRDL